MQLHGLLLGERCYRKSTWKCGTTACLHSCHKKTAGCNLNEPMYLEAEMILGQLHHRWVERCWNSKAGFASSKSILTGRPSFLADNLPMYCSLVKVRWSGETLPFWPGCTSFLCSWKKKMCLLCHWILFHGTGSKIGIFHFPENGAAQNHGVSSIYDPSPCHKHDELAVSGWKRWWKANWGPSADPIHISIWEWHGMDKKITRNRLKHPKRAGFPGAIKYHQISSNIMDQPMKLWIYSWSSTVSTVFYSFLQPSTDINCRKKPWNLRPALELTIGLEDSKTMASCQRDGPRGGPSAFVMGLPQALILI